MNLYEVTGQLLELQEIAESGEFDEEVLRDTMEGVEGEFEIKAEGYAMVLRNLEASTKALKAEEERLAYKRKTIENSIKRMKETLQNAMVATGKRKFDSGIFKFSIAKNGGALPIILDCEVESLPESFTKVSVEADKNAIKEYLETHDSCEYAHFGERGESLRIK